jgi:hypothetical protein
MDALSLAASTKSGITFPAALVLASVLSSWQSRQSLFFIMLAASALNAVSANATTAAALLDFQHLNIERIPKQFGGRGSARPRQFQCLNREIIA